MFKQNDSSHLVAMQEMQELANKPGEIKIWFESKNEEFESLPDNG